MRRTLTALAFLAATLPAHAGSYANADAIASGDWYTAEAHPDVLRTYDRAYRARYLVKLYRMTGITPLTYLATLQGEPVDCDDIANDMSAPLLLRARCR